MYSFTALLLWILHYNILLHRAYKISLNASHIWTTTPSHHCVKRFLSIGCTSPKLYHPGLYSALQPRQSNPLNVNQSALELITRGRGCRASSHITLVSWSLLTTCCLQLGPSTARSCIDGLPGVVFLKCARGWSRVDAECSRPLSSAPAACCSASLCLLCVAWGFAVWPPAAAAN